MQMPPAADRRQLSQLFRSVVKILSVSDAPDYDQPWQTRGAVSSAGSGAIVATKNGPRVLTNAHCVENHAFIEVRRYGKSRKYVAKVEALGYECDLALLDIEDPAFYHGTVPIPLGELPELSDQVSVCGYPVGGERMSITNGVVSRIEIVRYAHRQRRLLAVQIDAAINAGNRGGPVIMEGKIVGVAFQALDEAEHIGYMIAVPVIEHFMRDVKDGRFEGFPSLGIVVQPLESRAHRRQLGLPKQIDGGILVNRIVHGGSASGTLREDDVLLEVDGTEIAADGTVEFRNGEMLSFDYVISRHHVGETVDVKIWRDGGALSCVVRLKAPKYLVAEERYDAPPTYFIYGGLLFVPLTRDYLRTWDDWWMTAPKQLVALYERGIPTSRRAQPVVLQKVLADSVNQGYHALESVLIYTCQGKRVRSLAHMIEIIASTQEDFVRFASEDGLRVVIDTKEAAQRSEKVLARFRVSADRSSDLLPG
ncbi:MAG: trypsin-like peptidase domain-containing protein [Myxococcota bacterium]